MRALVLSFGEPKVSNTPHHRPNIYCIFDFSVLGRSDLISCKEIWVTELSSAGIITFWVNNKTSFGQHSAYLLRCTQACVHVVVVGGSERIAPLLASSLAELSASYPICSSHMALSFSRKHSSLPSSLFVSFYSALLALFFFSSSLPVLPV